VSNFIGLAGDPYNLHRFIEAQNSVYEHVCADLRQGSKRGHWMWFIFPQIEGLGHSELARRYAISSLDEARAYLNDPLLGARLRECAKLVVQTQGKTIHEILGYPDDMKFRSSMTLFARAASDNEVFEEALRKYFGGEYDPLTLKRLTDAVLE
jgi:uncharacterized protein (DUF1810 family)